MAVFRGRIGGGGGGGFLRIPESLGNICLYRRWRGLLSSGDLKEILHATSSVFFDQRTRGPVFFDWIQSLCLIFLWFYGAMVCYMELWDYGLWFYFYGLLLWFYGTMVFGFVLCGYGLLGGRGGGEGGGVCSGVRCGFRGDGDRRRGGR